MSGKVIVVSGATGMIGRALTEEILKNGDRVIAVVHKGSKRGGEIARAGVEVLPLDLSEYAGYEPTAKADIFFHLAWEKTLGEGRDNAELQLLNVRYTLDAVRLAARFGCKKFVGAGSQAEYGPVSSPLTGNTPADPQSGYGIAKYTAGKLSRMLADSLGLSHCWARILSVYGVGDAKTTLISYLIETLRKGETPALTPCGQIWDYLYAADAARALYLIGEKGVNGKVYPVGSGEQRPLREYVEVLRDEVAPGAEIAFGAKEYYPHQPMFLSADLTELTADTGFRPAVPFAEGIRKIIGKDKV